MSTGHWSLEIENSLKATSGYTALMSLLSITDLSVSVEKKEIIHSLSLQIEEGEIHAIMGPNGSGKSTLVNTLMGHPKCIVTKGKVLFKGTDLLLMTPDARARIGLFLAFQYPRELAGVTLRSFLFAAYKARHGERVMLSPVEARSISPLKFKKLLEEAMHELHMDPAFAERSVNQGFSGGEKKKAEILQMKILKPTLALLDETDSGLDIDALKIVAEGVNALRRPNPNPNSNPFSALLVTHYARILEYITPDKVHVMVDGKIVESGGKELAKTLEKEGYAKYGVEEKKRKIMLDV